MYFLSKRTIERRLLKYSSNKSWWPQFRPQTTWRFHYWQRR